MPIFFTKTNLLQSAPEVVTIDYRENAQVVNVYLEINEHGGIALDQLVSLKKWAKKLRSRKAGFGMEQETAGGFTVLGLFTTVPASAILASTAHVATPIDAAVATLTLLPFIVNVATGSHGRKTYKSLYNELNISLHKELQRWLEQYYDIPLFDGYDPALNRIFLTEGGLGGWGFLYNNIKYRIAPGARHWNEAKVDEDGRATTEYCSESLGLILERWYGDSDAAFASGKYGWKHVTLVADTVKASAQLAVEPAGAEREFSEEAQTLIFDIQKMFTAFSTVNLGTESAYVVNRAQKDLREVILIQKQTAALGEEKNEPDSALRVLRNLHGELSALKQEELNRLASAFDVHDIYVESRQR